MVRGPRAPSGATRAGLDASAARFEIFTTPSRTSWKSRTRSDYGNLDTRLEPCTAADPRGDAAGLARILSLPGWAHSQARRNRQPSRAWHRIRPDMRQRTALRCASGGPRGNATSPKSNGWWRNSTARVPPKPPIANIRSTPGARGVAGIGRRAGRLRPSTPRCCRTRLRADAVLAGGDRGIVDLLAVDRAGRLPVIELKASAIAPAPASSGLLDPREVAPGPGWSSRGG